MTPQIINFGVSLLGDDSGHWGQQGNSPLESETIRRKERHMNKLVQKHREEEGFTLIELLIVIIILGILAAVVIFGVSTLREDSVEKACQTDKKQVSTAVAAYLAKNNATPSESAPGVDPGLVAGGFLQSYPSTENYRIDYDKGSGNTYTVKALATTATADDPTPADEVDICT